MNQKKTELRNSTNLYNFYMTAKAGVHKAIHDPHKGAPLLVLLAVLAVIAYKLFIPATIPRVLYPVCTASALVFFLTIAALIAAIVGYERGAIRMQNDFVRIGFVNSAGEAPYLINKIKKENNIMEYEFQMNGLPVVVWTDRQAELESALNMYIAKVSEGADRRTVIVQCVEPSFAFTKIMWDDKIINARDDALLVLGDGLLGKVVVNLDATPHILLGGSTGSGKTMLLKVLLRQGAMQGDTVYLADYKGAVDYAYNRKWNSLVHLIITEDELLRRLQLVADEIEARKEAFRAVGVPNIKAYRAKTGDYLPRIIVACDEVAELMDKTGADKERKELLNQIEALLSLIARQGRAFGVHLILSTQRPDANILSGQIKNNMDIRVCGRADTTLSTIIMGDGSADKQIPKDAQGRFLTNDGTLFQGYYFDDSDDEMPH